MKSILVDALRQANDDESDPKLDDSGRFGTVQEDFAVTANQVMDDAAIGEDAAELELMSTTRDLVVGNDDAVADERPLAQLSETLAGGTVLLTGSDRVVPDSRSLPPMPRLARHVPMLCVALALFSAAAWQGYQHLELRQDTSSLGAVAIQSQAAGEEDEPVSADSPVQRFRYLRSALPAAGDEGAK